MSKVTFVSRRSVVAVSDCPVFWRMDLCNMLSRQILQMVAMGLALREVAGRSTFSMSLQGLLTPWALSIYEKKKPEISVGAKVEFPIGKKLFHLVRGGA